MRIDTIVQLTDAATGDERAHRVRVEAADVSTPQRLFDALATALEFPDYFGRNWDALDECFSDFFVLEDGGLGSEFGGRDGIAADSVLLVVAHAGGLLRDGPDLARRLGSLLRHTGESNAGRRAADLTVVFQVDGDDERAAVEAALTAGP